MLVDSHVNLHSDQYDEDCEEIIAAARAAGVTHMLTISDKLESANAIEAITNRHDFIWRSVGVHPHYASGAKDLSAETLIEMANDPKVVGIGECGLDFHYEYSDRSAQRPVFQVHIDAARETGLPLIIHTREADEETSETLVGAFGEGPFTPLLHCYTGGPVLAKTVFDMGGYISFSGILTFKNAHDIREIAAAAPMDRIIIETDCPYLAPVPMRGRRNEPAYLTHVAEKLAEVRCVSIDEIAATTTENFFRLFSRAQKPVSV